jgi:wobble nucleotide-excising tRNase
MTAYKIALDLISAVKLSLQCLELIDAKQASLMKTQPVFSLFIFGHKAQHPYADLKSNAVQAQQHLMRLAKGIAGWDIRGKNIAFELDAIKAKHLVDGVGEDMDVVDLVRGWKKRNINAQVAADNMEQAFREATTLWSNSSKKAVRDNIKNYMGSMKVDSCIEKPEIDIQAECKKLVNEIKKLNKDLRGVTRMDSTMMNCYSKKQVMYVLRSNVTESVLEVLMK